MRSEALSARILAAVFRTTHRPPLAAYALAYRLILLSYGQSGQTGQSTIATKNNAT